MLKYRDVNDAFYSMVHRYNTALIEGDEDYLVTDSRNGPVISCKVPVTIAYANPRERVLFSKVRDANPFFHMYESLWMLMGRNDVESLKYFVSSIGQFSDDGDTFNGAYGYRWRHALDTTEEYREDWGYRFDQLGKVINHLRQFPFSRRAVIGMWNASDDTALMAEDGTGSKDVCCNLSVKFRVLPGLCPLCEGVGYNGGRDCPLCKGQPMDRPRTLDMTVFNRSNDLLLGALGANVVHFSMLQEYVALNLGLKVGTYYQISSDMHVYTEHPTWKPQRYIDELVSYRGGMPRQQITMPLVSRPGRFDQELPFIVNRNTEREYGEPFFEHVAKPAFRSFEMHKQRKYIAAVQLAERIQCPAWKRECLRWINKRRENYERKHHHATSNVED